MINKVFFKALMKYGNLAPEEQPFVPSSSSDGLLLNDTQLAMIHNARADFPSLKDFCKIVPVSDSSGTWITVDSPQLFFQQIFNLSTVVSPQHIFTTPVHFTINDFVLPIIIANSHLKDWFDQGVDIISMIASDIARAQVERENIQIVSALTASLTPNPLTDYAGLCKALFHDLPQRYFNSAQIITNPDGLLWLTTLTDDSNRPLLSPSADSFSLWGKPVIVLSNVALPSDDNFIPMFVGDSSQACLFFERQGLALQSFSRARDLFERDASALQCTYRFAVEINHVDAMRLLHISKS